MAIKITLPDIVAGEKENTFTLNRKKARVRNLPDGWRCEFILTYPDLNQSTGNTNSDQTNYYEYATNEFLLPIEAWKPDKILTLYFLNNTQEAAVAASYDITIIDIGTEIELYHYNIPYLAPTDKFEFNIYPTEESNQVKIKIKTTPEIDVASYFDLKINTENRETLRWSTDDWDTIKEEEKFTHTFQTINNLDRAKITMEAILYDEHEQAMSINQQPIDESKGEVSLSSDTYLTYTPPIDNTRGIDVKSSIVSVNEQIITEQQPSIQVLNKSQIVVDWSNIVPFANFQTPYWYLLRPRLYYKSWYIDAGNIENFNLNINAHLRDAYIEDPIEIYEYNKYGQIETKSRFKGYPISNYKYDNNIAYGLPLVSDIFNKNNENVQKWSGVIATVFLQGQGTQEQPYIISTPEELARAILKDGETRYELWKKRKGYSAFEDTDEWRQEYFHASTGEWKDDTTRLYYEVSSECYAFDMGGLSDITLETSRSTMAKKEWRNAKNAKWYIDDKKKMPAYGFSGSLKGNGIVIYNLNGTAGNYAAGFIPLATGQVELQDIIIKNSHFSNTSNLIEYTTGGFIGAHTNYSIKGTERAITILNCMIINSQLFYRGDSEYGVAAAFVGNARYVPTTITNCCSYFNTFKATGTLSEDEICSIGGVIGCFQGGSEPGQLWYSQTNTPRCNRCGIVESSLVPQGQLYYSPIAHWGYKRALDLQDREMKLCNEAGSILSNTSDPPVQLNPYSKQYHFFSELNAYTYEAQNWTDTEPNYKALPYQWLPDPTSSWWETNWSEENWALYKQQEQQILDWIHTCWATLIEGLGESYAQYFYTEKTTTIVTKKNGKKTVSYLDWEAYYSIYRGPEYTGYDGKFINPYSQISVHKEVFDIDNEQYEHDLDTLVPADNKADWILRDVTNFSWNWYNTAIDGTHDVTTPFYLIRPDQAKLKQEYERIYKLYGQHASENAVPYTNRTEETDGILQPDGTIKVPGFVREWRSPTNIFYRKIRVPYNSWLDFRGNSYFSYLQRNTIFNISDLLNKNISYLYDHGYYKPKRVAANLKPDEQKFIFDLNHTVARQRGNDVLFWLEVEPYYSDPSNTNLPYYGRNTRIDSNGNEIVLNAHSPIIDVLPNPTVYIKSPYFGTYVPRKVYAKPDGETEYKEGRIFVRQNWDEENQRYNYKEAF